MSSGDDEFGKVGGGDDKAQKRGRVGRACDTCRRKKIRCDYATNPDKKCSNCAAYNYECTYVEAAKKRGPPKGYVESLESRLLKMETLLQRLCPDAEFTKDLGEHMDRETWWNERQSNPNSIPSSIPVLPKKPSPPVARRRGVNNRGGASGDYTASDDESVLPPLSEDSRNAVASTENLHFHGKSSGMVLMRTAMDLKREYTGKDSISDPSASGFANDWQGKNASGTANFEFPPQDLLEPLITLYFTKNNYYLPLLHRPTFERQFRDGLHRKDTGFAAVLLLVCAIGSRFSSDPRVLRADHGVDKPNTPPSQSAGWAFFDQVQMHKKSLLTPATLSDLQQYALASIFLQGSAAPYASWVMIGIGLRVAQDVGAHRRRNGPPTVESELWKRAFWVLVNLDRLTSAALGRPCAIHDEDFDLDTPLEVDDEFWEASKPENCFKQPSDRPSTVSYFNALIRLDQMLSFALRTIYSINKSKMILGFNGETNWAQDAVAELDTMLNTWLASVPPHLAWSSTTSPSSFPVFFQQSSILYATYYYIQILVHRPFIPRPGKPAPLSFPSLKICTNAARSCGQTLEYYRRNCEFGAAPFLMFFAFTSGLVSLLNIWGLPKQGGEVEDKNALMEDVYCCMNFLKACEMKWHLAGRLSTIIRELASVGDFPLPQASPTVSQKRERDSDSPKPLPDTMNAGRRPPKSQKSVPQAQRSIPQQPVLGGNFGLPVYGSESLGNMPLYPSQMFNNPHAPNTSPGAIDASMQPWFSEQVTGMNAEYGPGSSQAPMDVFQANQTQTFSAASQQYEGGHFPAQGGQNNFVDASNGYPEAGQNQPWGATLNMWSMAPTGFESEDWNHFINNMSTTSRSDDPHGPSS